jgi:hypothetical protein
MDKFLCSLEVMHEPLAISWELCLFTLCTVAQQFVKEFNGQDFNAVKFFQRGYVDVLSFWYI